MASQHPFPADDDGTKLLSSKERKVCLKFCAADDEVTQKRAKALLALDDGCTQAKAGLLAGLTRGQVNYLVTLYRKKGMDLFPMNTHVNAAQLDIKPSDTTESDPGKNKKKKKGKRKKAGKKVKKKKKDSPKKGVSKDAKKSKKKGKKTKKK